MTAPMAIQSARQADDRPFYAAYGWAYDLLITHPVQPWAEMITQFSIVPGSMHPRDPRCWLRNRPARR